MLLEALAARQSMNGKVIRFNSLSPSITVSDNPEQPLHCMPVHLNHKVLVTSKWWTKMLALYLIGSFLCRVLVLGYIYALCCCLSFHIRKKYQILPGKMQTNLLIICYVKGIKHKAWGPCSAQLQSKYNSSPVHWTPPENVKEGRPPP